MAIRTVVTRGYGNGTFNGTVGLVVTRGYAALAQLVPDVASLQYRAIKGSRLHFASDRETRLHFASAPHTRLHWSFPGESK